MPKRKFWRLDVDFEADDPETALNTIRRHIAASADQLITNGDLYAVDELGDTWSDEDYDWPEA